MNQSQNGTAIDSYDRKVADLGPDEREAMMAAAREFNAYLAAETPYIGELTAERRQIYDSLLDVTGSGIMGYIEAPKAGIYLAIYHGADEPVLQTGVGHLPASSLPVVCESAHVVLTGHSGLPSARLFTDIDQLDNGDTFLLHVLGETLCYRVEQKRRVLPEDLETLRIEKGKELCTLVTCTPYGVNTHRLAVTGRRVDIPDEGETSVSSAARAARSTWNRIYVFLPPVVFAGVVTVVVLVRRRRRKRKKREGSASI